MVRQHTLNYSIDVMFTRTGQPSIIDQSHVFLLSVADRLPSQSLREERSWTEIWVTPSQMYQQNSDPCQNALKLGV